MLNKTIKEYKGRQRIDLNKKDNMIADSEVVILTTDEYKAIKSQLFDLQNKVTAMEKELEIYQSQEKNLKQIVEDITAPIDEHYKKEIKNKDVENKRLEMELKALHKRVNRFTLELMDLNLLDKIRSKDSKLILSFNEEITTFEIDPKIVDADAKAIPGKDISADKK